MKSGREVAFRPLFIQTSEHTKSANDEVCAAAAIYPDATAIVSPTVALRASRIAALAHKLDTAAGIGGAVVPSAVV
jgi:hypothetical protein